MLCTLVHFGLHFSFCDDVEDGRSRTQQQVGVAAHRHVLQRGRLPAVRAAGGGGRRWALASIAAAKGVHPGDRKTHFWARPRILSA